MICLSNETLSLLQYSFETKWTFYLIVDQEIKINKSKQGLTATVTFSLRKMSVPSMHTFHLAPIFGLVEMYL